MAVGVLSPLVQSKAASATARPIAAKVAALLGLAALFSVLLASKLSFSRATQDSRLLEVFVSSPQFLAQQQAPQFLAQKQAPTIESLGFPFIGDTEQTDNVRDVICEHSC